MSSPSHVRQNLELKDYIRVLKRQKWLVAGITVAVLAITMIQTYRQAKVYEATASVLLDEGFSQSVLGADGTLPVSLDAQVVTEVDLMRSSPIRASIRSSLGYMPSVSVGVLPAADKSQRTRTISVVGKAGSIAEANKYANDFSNAYVKARTVILTEDLQGTISDLRQSIARLTLQEAVDRQRVADLNAEIAASPPEDVIALTIERDRLQTDLDSSETAGMIQGVESKINRLETAIVANQRRGIFRISRASGSTTPVSPVPKRNALAGLAIGLGLGVLAAFVRDYYDDTFRTKDDLDLATGGVPVLSIIPTIEGWRDRESAVLESLSHPNSAAAEAYRSLRASLEFIGVEQNIKIVHITSSAPGEGKSTTAANLSVTLARAGKRVVLVDCDLRRPRIHRFFGMSNDVGFTSAVVGTHRFEDVLQAAPGVAGLLVLPSGPTPPNPSELLSTKTVRTRLEALAGSADYVIVDSPPLLPVSDSVVLAGYADATMLVVTARSTTKRSLIRSLELLNQVDAPLEGLVFNGVPPEGTYGYGYSYGYRYSREVPTSEATANGAGRKRRRAAQNGDRTSEETFSNRSVREEQPTSPSGP